jgi:hypothetical protein
MTTRSGDIVMPAKVIAGAATLVAGAAVVDLGYAAGQPALEQVGNALAALGGIGLAFLPRALGVTSGAGRWVFWAGLALASLVDLPAVLDPTDLRAGRALGFPAMILLSAGLVLLWRRAREPFLLVAAAWFFVQFVPNVAFFIVPNARPSFILQVTGSVVPMAVAAWRWRQRSRIATTPWPPAAQMEMSPRP